MAKTVEKYYYIGNRRPEVGGFADSRWFPSIVDAQIACGECHRIQPAFGAQPIDGVVLEVPPACVHSYSCIKLVQSALLFALGQPLGAVIGRCLLRRGNSLTEIDEYRTIWMPPQHTVLMRGKGPVRIEECQRCHSRKFAFDERPHYLLKSEISGRESVMEHNGAWYVSQRIAESIDVSKWRYLRLESFPVFDEPLPGEFYDRDFPYSLMGWDDHES